MSISQEPLGGGPTLTITVYTSEKCIFCKEAVRVVRETANRLRGVANLLDIIEEDTPLKDKNAGGITAVPAIRVGDSLFVGVPSSEDVEFLINRALLSALSE
ncbi:MAG: hypothetical protein DRO73_08605 [Candidatus Thorarchaeota archaeon]|nr:MAG: hypothetical protein DRO73_08605 [Candidatus Thorarchaeota archaeon]RLI53982.1 MAG: hypothetical protein DRO93_13095 [Candidatus Thorarchaeota archaeon]